MVKKRKIGKGKYVLNWKIDSVENEMWCAADNHNYMCHNSVQKNFLDWQNIKFSRNGHKFHIFTKIEILKALLEIDRPTASSL